MSDSTCRTCGHNEVCVYLYRMNVSTNTKSLKPFRDIHNFLMCNNISCGHYRKQGEEENNDYLNKHLARENREIREDGVYER